MADAGWAGTRGCRMWRIGHLPRQQSRPPPSSSSPPPCLPPLPGAAATAASRTVTSIRAVKRQFVCNDRQDGRQHQLAGDEHHPGLREEGDAQEGLRPRRSRRVQGQRAAVLSTKCSLGRKALSAAAVLLTADSQVRRQLCSRGTIAKRGGKHSLDRHGPLGPLPPAAAGNRVQPWPLAAAAGTVP